MSSGYKIFDSGIAHFVTCTVVDWIDALSRPLYKDVVCDSLRFCIDRKGLQLHAWVIMSNHLHLIASAKEGAVLADVLRDFKKFTARKLVEAIAGNAQESRREWMLNAFHFAAEHNSSNKEIQFWQQGFHPICLDRPQLWRQRLLYLHENPVRAGLVWRAEDYKYSSAIDYYVGQPGLLSLLMQQW